MSNAVYVVDTNIIFRNPFFYNTLRDALIIIPSIVLQELDNHKTDGELGLSSRSFTRFLDKIYKNQYRVDELNIQFLLDYRVHNPEVIELLGGDIPDNRIIETANFFRGLNPDLILLSNDGGVRNKARGMGLVAEEFTSDLVLDESNGIYPGYKDIIQSGDNIDLLYSDGFLMISDQLKEYIFPHMFFKITDSYSTKSAIGKVNADMTKVELVNPKLLPIWGISSKNSGQRMALQLLLDPEIELVTLTGKAGTGKTILALAAGLVLSNDEDFYKNILLTKPVVPMGKDIGYLPGNKEEKLSPWMASYQDNVDFLLDGKTTDMEQLKLKIEALTYLRGRSLPQQYFIIDEAQNLNKHEVKTIITRAGEGTKIILMGDPNQIDAPYLDSINNGLSYVINKFRNSVRSGHVHLDKSVRSPLAEEAANIL